MTDRSKLLALAEAVEKLTGADRETDRAIARLKGWHRVEPRFSRSKHGAWIAPEDFIGTMSDGSPILDSLHGTDMHRDVPAFTASLDAAMTLVPEGCLAQVWRGHDNEGSATVNPRKQINLPRSFGATPALALCAAALRAQTETLS